MPTKSITIEEAQPGDIITALYHEVSDRGQTHRFSGEAWRPSKDHKSLYVGTTMVRNMHLLAPGYVTIESVQRELPDLPTEPGVIFRGTPDFEWATPNSPAGTPTTFVVTRNGRKIAYFEPTTGRFFPPEGIRPEHTVLKVIEP